MTRSLPDLIAGTSELRSLPTTTLRLLGLLDDTAVGADEVLDVIQTDPALTANLLRLCNSAYFGARRQVDSLRQGLVLLGNRTVINLAFAASLGDILRGPLAGYRIERNELWHHALGTALAAAHLASLHDDPSGRERAFTGGLVHDIGKLLLNGPLTEELVQLPPKASSEAILAAERKILGFDHAEAGAALGEAWNFPVSLVQLIATHHCPAVEADVWQGVSDPVRDLARAVGGANLVSGHCGFGGGAQGVGLDELLVLMADLDYGPDDVRGLVARLPEDLDSMLGVIGESR